MSLPVEMVAMLGAFAPLFSDRVWLHVQHISWRSNPRARHTHRHPSFTRHGIERREEVDELPSGIESSRLVAAASQQDPARIDPQTAAGLKHDRHWRR